jgi:Tfp pilus assembly protein PilP
MTGGPRASALLRECDGTIRKVAVGDRTDAGRVERIAEDHVILRRRDRLYQLALAG